MSARQGAQGAVAAILAAVAAVLAIGCSLVFAVGSARADDFSATEFATGNFAIAAWTAAGQMPGAFDAHTAGLFTARAGDFDAAAFAIGGIRFAALAPADQMLTAPLPQMTAPRPQATEPFALESSAPFAGGIERKWRVVKGKLPGEHDMLARCRANDAACTPAARKFLTIIERAAGRNGWARIAEINRAINLDIRPVADIIQYGVIDLWASPLMTFASNAGDCEDYAIAKYVALEEIGVPATDLRLVIVHDRATNEDHAVAAVRQDGDWLILDNRTLEMRRDAELDNFDPLFVIDADGVKHATINRVAPRLARADVVPSAAGNPLVVRP